VDNPINLKKGSSIDLTKAGLKKIIVGLGWQINDNFKGAEHDLDVSAFLCQDINGSPKLLSNKHFVFYNNKKSPDGAVVHSGDVLVGGDTTEDLEQICIDLEKLDPAVEEISFVVTINDAADNNHNFGQVKYSHIRVINALNNKEIARYAMHDEFKHEIGLQCGSLIKTDGKWEFKAIGAAGNQELADFVLGYGGTVG